MFKRSLLTIFILTLLLGGGLWFFYFQRQGKISKVRVEKVSRGTVIASISASGTAKPSQEIELKFTSGGKITWLPVKVGDKVKARQAVASLDQESLRNSLESAKANLRKYQSLYIETYETYKVEPQTLKIIQELKQAEEDLRSAEIAVEAAEIALKNANLVTPISGTVLEVNNRVGEMFSTLSTKPVVVIGNLELWDFIAEVDETDIGGITIGQKAKIGLDAFPEEEFAGEVLEIESISHLTSSGGTAFAVKIRLNSPENTILRKGMSGEAEIIISEKQNVLLVPLEAVLEKEEEFFVFLVRDSRAELRKIKVGLISEKRVEVVSGVSEGEEVVIGDLEKLREGQKVHVTAD